MLSKQQALTLLVLGTLLLYLGYSYYNTTPDSYKAVYHNIVFKNLNRITSQRIQNLFYKKAETAEIPIVLHTIGPNVGKTTTNTVFSSTTSSTLMFTETSKTIDKVKNQTNSANNNFFSSTTSSTPISTKTSKTIFKVENQTNSANNDLIIKLMTNHGLGNLMFMYASALGIALTNKRKLRVEPFVKKMNDNFNLSSEWVNSSDPNVYPTLHYPKCCKYYEETERLPNKRFAIFGYYVSWKYFHKYNDIIRREFSFSGSINKEKESFLNKIKKLYGNTTLVGVHIRQGDFITSGHLGYSVASKEYIEQAIDYFKTRYNCTFLIATNGKTDWISSIFSSISNIQYHFTNLKAYVDMAVLSSCDHVITSTGTFSWWIGYFSKGTVLYYKDFPKKGSWLMTTQFEDMGDYFLPGWIGLP